MCMTYHLWLCLRRATNLSKKSFESHSACGERGIRTPETVSPFTRFPGVPLQPLEHLSLPYKRCKSRPKLRFDKRKQPKVFICRFLFTKKSTAHRGKSGKKEVRLLLLALCDCC